MAGTVTYKDENGEHTFEDFVLISFEPTVSTSKGTSVEGKFIAHVDAYQLFSAMKHAVLNATKHIKDPVLKIKLVEELTRGLALVAGVEEAEQICF